MTQPNNLWPQYVDRVLRKHGLSRRGQRIRTRIPHSTVNSWFELVPPQYGNVVQFAAGLGEDINEALKAAGFDPLPELQALSAWEWLVDELRAMERELKRPVLPHFNLHGGFATLTQEEAESVVAELREYFAEKADNRDNRP